LPAAPEPQQVESFFPADAATAAPLLAGLPPRGSSV